MNIKKKAFTLSEALVTLAILGVLAAILIPVLDNVRPDKDRIMYKKAMYAMQGAVSSVMDEITAVATNTSAYWADTSVGEKDFCKKVANSLNLRGGDLCEQNYWANEDPTKYIKGSNEPDFITTDGVMWWGLAQYKFGYDPNPDNPHNANEMYSPIHNIYITRKDQYNSAGDMKDGYKPLKILVRYDGRVGTGTGSDWGAENEFIEDSLKINQTKKTEEYDNN